MWHSSNTELFSYPSLYLVKAVADKSEQTGFPHKLPDSSPLPKEKHRGSFLQECGKYIFTRFWLIVRIRDGNHRESKAAVTKVG